MGIFQVLFTCILCVTLQVQYFVITQYKMHFAACCLRFRFQFVDQPETLREYQAPVKEITQQYDMPIPESPVEIFIDHLRADNIILKL